MYVVIADEGDERQMICRSSEREMSTPNHGEICSHLWGIFNLFAGNGEHHFSLNNVVYGKGVSKTSF